MILVKKPPPPAFSGPKNEIIFGAYADESDRLVMHTTFRDLVNQKPELLGVVAAVRVTRRFLTANGRNPFLYNVLYHASSYPLDEEKAAVLIPGGSFTIYTDPVIRGLEALTKVRELWDTDRDYANKVSRLNRLQQLLETCSAPMPEILGPEWRELRKLVAFDVWDNRPKDQNSGTHDEDGRLAEEALRHPRILVVHR